MRRRIGFVLATVAILSALGCAGPNPLQGTPGAHGVAGFWMGLWNGITAPVMFIVSLFNHRVHFYEVHNNGGWYNFGFVLGTGILAGGSFRRTKRS